MSLIKDAIAKGEAIKEELLKAKGLEAQQERIRFQAKVESLLPFYRKWVREDLPQMITKAVSENYGYVLHSLSYRTEEAHALQAAARELGLTADIDTYQSTNVDGYSVGPTSYSVRIRWHLL